MNTELRRKVFTEAAMSMISEQQSKEFDKLLNDKRKKAELHENIRNQIDHITEVLDKVRKSKIKNWDAFNHFPDAEERKERIKSALEMKTFKMTLNKSTNKVDVTRYGKKLQVLPASSDESQTLQMASIVVEAIILVLEVIGISIPDTEEDVQKAIKEALEALQKSQTLIDDVDNILEAYANDDKFGMVTGIIYLVIDCVSAGVFWDITKALLSDMAWYDWIFTSAKIAAAIVVIIATDGAAEIAELVAILVDAAFFMEKLANLAIFKKLSA